jgi:hypothetical protein
LHFRTAFCHCHTQTLSRVLTLSSASIYPFSSKLGVRNARKAPQLVAVEPWANDYTLLADEELEIVAFGDTETPWFNVVEWDGVTQVYCEATVNFKVVQGDRELECGHQRQD